MSDKFNKNNTNKNQNKKHFKNGNSFEPDNFNWKKAGKTSFIWMAIILGAVYVSGLLTNVGKQELEIEYTEYKKYLDLPILTAPHYYLEKEIVEEYQDNILETFKV